MIAFDLSVCAINAAGSAALMIGICRLYLSSTLRIVVAGAFALGVAACASEPKVDALIDAASKGRAQVVGARGPLSERDSQAIIERLSRQSAKSDVLQRHIALEQALVDAPLIAGNKVQLLRDGPETFAAMFAAMDAAKQ